MNAQEEVQTATTNKEILDGLVRNHVNASIQLELEKKLRDMKEMIKNRPNDADLGAAIRAMWFE